MTNGSLSFDEEGVRLDLDGPLRGPKVLGQGIVGGSPEAASEAILHGRLNNGQEITLLHAQGWSVPVDEMTETWIADFALTGGLINDDTFTEMVVIFDDLMTWVDPPGMLRSDLLSSSITVETKGETLDETTLDDERTVLLISGVEGRSSDDSVHLDQWCGVKVTAADPRPVLDVLNEWARPLQDLLVVCIGRPVRLEEILLRGPGHDPRRASLKLFFKAVQPTARTRPHINSYDSPTLLTYANSPLPFSTLIAEWFSMHERLSDAITLLCGPYYAPFIYGSHRYASTFQSAEALAIAIYKRKEKNSKDHQERVEAVAAALMEADLDPEIVGWATRVIKGHNEKSLRQLMEELILSAGDTGQQVLESVPKLPDILAAARTSVAHPGGKGPGTLARYWLGEALIWILRVRLLAELGVPISDLSARVAEKSAFQDVLRELANLWPSQEERA